MIDWMINLYVVWEQSQKEEEEREKERERERGLAT